MWPTFYIPSLVRAAPNLDCFYLYTKTADETRNAASGRYIDGALQFPTEANSAYWVTGHLAAKIVSATGDPGISFGVLHDGDTVALASRTQCGTAFVASSNTTTDIDMFPHALTHINAYPYGRATPVANNLLSFFPECTIVTGASGGTCGVGWGLYDLGAAGSTALLAGSFLYVRKLAV